VESVRDACMHYADELIAVFGLLGERSILSANHLNAAKTIYTLVKNLGFEPELHPVKAYVHHGERMFSVDAYNVVIPSETEDPKLVLIAHFDSYPTSPGAEDNASGVISILVLMRLLASYVEKRVARNVEVVFTTAEEFNAQGLLVYLLRPYVEDPYQLDFMVQSVAKNTSNVRILFEASFAQKAVEDLKSRLYIVVDTVARGNVIFVLNEHQLDVDLVYKELRKTFANVNAYSEVFIWPWVPEQGDVGLLNSLGLPFIALSRYSEDTLSIIHTPKDTFDHLSPETLCENAEILYQLLKILKELKFGG